MKDPASDLLMTVLNQEPDARVLWVVDENLSEEQLANVNASSSIIAITNRYDLYTQLSNAGLETELSDFEFAKTPDDSVDVICFRVSKEKPIVHHVINRSADILKPGGRLVLIGAKNEGIKTYIKKAAAYLGGDVIQQRGDKTYISCSIERSPVCGERLDDKQYTECVTLVAAVPGTSDEITFVSKPGVYGWQKIDRGSEFLVSVLRDILARSEILPATILDLGCGFGYLSVMANALVPATYIATDNNYASVRLCEKNFSQHTIRGSVVLADCGDSIEQKVDMVLCNPPFHLGFAIERDLTLRFLEAAHRLLRPGGIAVFVVNGFIPLEKLSRQLFASTELVASNSQFKVIQLAR